MSLDRWMLIQEWIYSITEFVLSYEEQHLFHVVEVCENIHTSIYLTFSLMNLYSCS